MNGYGYGVSIFYGDSFLYFPALLRLIGVGVQDAYKCYILFINVLTCLISFYSFQKFTGDDRLGLAGSFLFTASVYRLNCIYVRAAVGEYTAMAFMPLYVYGIYAMLFWKGEKRKGAWLCTALGFSGIVRTHIISSEIAALYGIVAGLVYFRWLFDKELWIDISKCALLILGCSASFLAPFLDLSRDAYVFNREIGKGIQTSGATWCQIWNPFPSGRGEAFSVSMTERAGVDSQFSYAIGLGFTVAILLYLYFFVVLERNRNSVERKESRHFFYWCMVLLIMTTVWFPWNFLQEALGNVGYLIARIQFPWRILGITSTVLAFFCCNLLAALRICEKANSRILYGIVMVSAVLSSGYFLSDRMNDNHTFYIQNADDLDNFRIMGGEYMPEGAAVKRSASREVVPGGEIAIKSVERRYHRFHILLNVPGSETAYLELPLLFYRGYAAKCEDGTWCKVEAGESGKVRLYVPGGYSGAVDVFYQEAWYWRAAELISAGSILWLMLKGAYALRKRKRYS